MAGGRCRRAALAWSKTQPPAGFKRTMFAVRLMLTISRLFHEAESSGAAGRSGTLMATRPVPCRRCRHVGSRPQPAGLLAVMPEVLLRRNLSSRLTAGCSVSVELSIAASNPMMRPVATNSNPMAWTPCAGRCEGFRASCVLARQLLGVWLRVVGLLLVVLRAVGLLLARAGTASGVRRERPHHRACNAAADT